MSEQLSTQPYKGARDFYPEDMEIQNYIYNTWKSVCKSFGYQEYSFPILEPLEIFSAKTGEEIVNNQLFSFEDKGGRKLAIRPELTPGTVRMLAQKYKELNSPVRWFMIGNNWRFESPQKGRGREFNQLEVNIFGEKSVNADFEIFLIIIEIMKAFGATNTMFTLSYSDRRLISLLLQEYLQLDEQKAKEIRRIMDKRAKMSAADFAKTLADKGLSQEQADSIEKFMNSDLSQLEQIFPTELLQNNQGYKNLQTLASLILDNNLEEYCKFDPAIIRGFDYSDGLVYEVFDNNPTNKRSLFGGERFDKLINIFNQNYDLPATGFAMGDMTLLEFLKGWELIPDFGKNNIDYLVTVWPNEDSSAQNKYLKAANTVSQSLRANGATTVTWLNTNTKLDKQLKYADKQKVKNAIIIGDSELENGQITIKNLQTGTQTTKSLDEFLNSLK